uniref:Uncharacterized protein n=1 Tax=Solanum tuberosum TaxID=4113 RepID=M1DHC8_SOLTU
MMGELTEEIIRASASVGEDLGRASASVGEDLGRASVSVGEDMGGTSSAAAAFDIPKVGSDWESETEASDDSDNADLPDEGEDEYGSDVHEEASATGRRRGTTTSNGTNIGVAADGSGATGRGKGIGTDLAERGRGTATGLAGREKELV